MLKKNYIFFLFYLSILLGFFFDEDTLGGSKNDYIFHLDFIELFDKDLLNGLLVYGYEDYPARNSPFFYIVISILNDLISLDQIRLINTLSSLILAILFYKTLKLHYPLIKKNKLRFLSCIVFFSPTIRSLSVWPYPILWSYIFFLISIYYYIFFQKKNQSKYIYYCFISLIMSSYLNYTFSVFGIFYLISFFKNKNYGFDKLKLIIFLFLSSIPAIFFLFFREGIHVFGLADGFSLTIYDTLNISNKILIISSILFLYLLSFLRIKDIYFDFKNILNLQSLFYIILFGLLILFFNYPNTNNFGGGIFFKISYLLFNNNYLFLFISLLSLIFILKMYKGIKNIFFIFLILILYNLQFTIYMKYYDPLIFFIIFFLLDRKIVDRFFENKYFLHKIYSFVIFIYLIFLFRNEFNFI